VYTLVHYFQQHGMLRKSVWCFPCNRTYTLVKYKGSVTGYNLRCPGCRNRTSLQLDSFLDGAHVPLAKLLSLLYFCASGTGVTQTVHHLGCSSETVVQWYQYFRDICLWKLLNTPVKLGGPGKTVEIDESVMVKAKYHRGHQLTMPQRWVFGVYDPETKLGYIELVTKRDAATLLPIIQRVVEPGTTIWSDEWAAYGQLSSLGYTHSTVNHSRNIKDPITGTCTNHVAAYWCAVKRRFKKMTGTYPDMVPSHLDEHMWRKRFGRTPQLALLNLQCHIAERYPLA